MKYLIRVFIALMVGALSLYLTATVFASSVWVGPILIFLFVCSLLYSFVLIYKWKPAVAKVLAEICAQFLLWP